MPDDDLSSSYNLDSQLIQAGDLSLQLDHLGSVTDRPESTAGTGNGYQYAYDQNDRLKQVIHNGVFVQSWQYDANGNRTHENGERIAEYDAQDRSRNLVSTFGGSKEGRPATPWIP